MHKPMAYTYDADVHCETCAEARFGVNERGFIGEDDYDSEGNRVGVIFSWDIAEWLIDQDTLSCGDCFEVIAQVF